MPVMKKVVVEVELRSSVVYALSDAASLAENVFEAINNHGTCPWSRLKTSNG
jgi:hypothetical protein